MSSVFLKSNTYVHIHQKGRKDTYQWLKSGYLQKVVLHIFHFLLCAFLYFLFFCKKELLLLLSKKGIFPPNLPK